MADEKRAGPWVYRGDAWERHAPQRHHALYGTLVASITHDSTLWWTVDGGYRNAPTPEAARAAADEALRAEGWVLEALDLLGRPMPSEDGLRDMKASDPLTRAGFTIQEVRDLSPEEREARVSMLATPFDPYARLGIVRPTATPGGRWGGPSPSAETHAEAERFFGEPSPAPVVAIIRCWAADRDAGRAIGEGASVLLDELLEAVGSGRPVDGPSAWMREPGAGGALGPPSVAIVSPGGGGVSPNALPVAPPATEARGRLVAGAWVETEWGWLRNAPDGTEVANVQQRLHSGACVWEVPGTGHFGGTPTPEAARQAADAALRAAGWELQ